MLSGGHRWKKKLKKKFSEGMQNYLCFFKTQETLVLVVVVVVVGYNQKLILLALLLRLNKTDQTELMVSIGVLVFGYYYSSVPLQTQLLLQLRSIILNNLFPFLFFYTLIFTYLFVGLFFCSFCIFVFWYALYFFCLAYIMTSNDAPKKRKKKEKNDLKKSGRFRKYLLHMCSFEH